MSDIAIAPAPRAGALVTFFEVSRFHIICIATLAALTFGWFLTGQWLALAAVVCAVDWFIVNLTNRVVDLAEDRANGIVGTDLVERRGRWLEAGCWALLLGSLGLVQVVAPGMLVWRIAFHVIGLAYNYKLIPAPSGRTRFKEIYFFKNFGSAVLFVLSTMAYPASLAGSWQGAAQFAVLAAFFLPLEITYEIFYDLRDVKGDAELRVPTFPVIHGIGVSHAIVWGLLTLSAGALLVGFAVHAIGARELMMIAAPIQQAILFKLRIARGATARDCILATYLGAGQTLSFCVWVWAGLPLP